jgi:glycosyltransferase involved in cell wall biosynthesis
MNGSNKQPVVRVYMPTYRRSDLLKRALNSLLAQTFTDWVCEIHNDCPGDDEPGKIVAAADDSRLTMIEHASNLGGTSTFNSFFRVCREPYMSILEDDNWWEPTFLEEMISTMNSYPEVSIAWSNMNVWEEQFGGTWVQTGRQVSPTTPNQSPALHQWGEPAQAFGALHSNGAMLARTEGIERYVIPQIEFSFIESFRERTFPWPLLFVPKPLANFALTKNTHRSRSREHWEVYSVLLVGSFASQWAYTKERIDELWDFARSRPLRTTDVLLAASFQSADLKILRQPAKFKEWLNFIASSLRHPKTTWQRLRARTNHLEFWDFLSNQTRIRAEEATARRQS